MNVHFEFILLLWISFSCLINIHEACPTVYPVLTGDPRLPDETLSASSISRVGKVGPEASRLRGVTNGDRGGGWEAASNILGEYIQVDLLHVNRIAAIATQGREDDDHFVTEYYIKLSVDGIVFHNYAEDTTVKLFQGNTDRNTVVNNTLRDSPEARFVRLYPTQWYKHISMRWEVYICSACLEPHPLLSGDPSVPDRSLAASSWNDDSLPSYSRLNNRNIWRAEESSVGQYIQVYLWVTRIVHSIATQGMRGGGQWVSDYYIMTSTDGVTYTHYTENRQVKTFAANTDDNSVVQHALQPETRARYIRLYPTRWHGHIALRWEVYGCPTDMKCQTVHPVLTGDPQLPDTRVTASSSFSNEHNSSRSRLHTRLHGNQTDNYGGAWVAETPLLGQYIQVDLGAFSMLHSVATQGRHDSNEYVKEYYLMFSETGAVFYNYTQNSVTQMFSGNSDNNTIVQHHIWHFKAVRYIRLLPTKWQTNMALRWEVYLCSNCPEGTYGRDCSLPCHCSGATPLCYEFSGQCVGDCQPGWHGDTCQIENRAYNQTTRESSAYLNNGVPQDGSKAVDGSSSSDISSCWHDRGKDLQYLLVELEKPIRVLEVWMLNRDSYPDRLRRVSVVVTEDSTTIIGANFCFHHDPADTPASGWLKGPCDATGRYIIVWKYKQLKAPLTICEIVVVSDAEPKPRPDAVENFRVISDQGTAATIGWDAPYWTSLALHEFHISLYTDGPIGCDPNTPKNRINVTKGPDVTHYTFPKLELGLSYVVDIVPVTNSIEGGGPGKQKASLRLGTATNVSSSSLEVTTIVTDLTTHSLTITWSPPDCQKWGAPFKQYTVGIDHGNGTRYVYSIVDYGIRSYTFDSLFANTVYNVTIAFETTLTSSTLLSRLLKTKAEKPGDKGNIAIIAGSVVGATVFIITVVAVSVVLAKKRNEMGDSQRQSDSSGQQATSAAPTTSDGAPSSALPPPVSPRTVSYISNVYSDLDDNPEYIEVIGEDGDYDTLQRGATPPPPVYAHPRDSNCSYD